ncbi:hypothetical protein [Raoultibacter phocaeensis]|uniref:hypothetical protein n=1 Tax=Raoultibacter phocaeensis TaxID=2479841 RepID=UPI00111A9A08|nr:hypothetical protein [Raoultibacter phocaeensis]
MDQNSTTTSRKEILPVFIGTVVGAIVLFAAMNALQPMLMENNYIHDFGTMLTGAMEGTVFYKVMWYFADFTEATFIASVPASIFMIIGGFVAAYLERKKSRYAGTGVDGHGHIFSGMFFATAAAILLGMLVFGELYPGWTGWIPTFAVVLTVQVLVLFFGVSAAKIATSVLLGTLITFPVVYVLQTFVVGPLALPLFVAVSIGVFIVVPLCTALFKLFPWMKIVEPETPPAEEIKEEEAKSSPTSFFLNRVFGDVGELAIWGSSIATVAMYVGAIIGWFLNPLEPAYGAGNFPLLIASQIVVAALAIFIYYPKWKKEGWAFTFPGIVLVSAIVGSYAATGTISDIVVAVLTIAIGATIFAPMVEKVMALFRYKGSYHVIALIQLCIFSICIIWSFVLMYVILPLFAG